MRLNGYILFFFGGGDQDLRMMHHWCILLGCVPFANCFHKVLNVALIGAFFAKDLDSYLPAVLLHFDDYKIAATEYQ